MALTTIDCDACGAKDSVSCEVFPDMFPVDQSLRTVMLLFTSPTSSFDVTFGAPCYDGDCDDTGDGGGGRIFVFAGKSSLSECPTPRPTEAPTAAPSSSPAPTPVPSTHAPTAPVCGDLLAATMTCAGPRGTHLFDDTSM